jgi:hypothetical protein
MLVNGVDTLRPASTLPQNRLVRLFGYQKALQAMLILLM